MRRLRRARPGRRPHPADRDRAGRGRSDRPGRVRLGRRHEPKRCPGAPPPRRRAASPGGGDRTGDGGGTRRRRPRALRCRHRRDCSRRCPGRPDACCSRAPRALGPCSQMSSAQMSSSSIARGLSSRTRSCWATSSSSLPLRPQARWAPFRQAFLRFRSDRRRRARRAWPGSTSSPKRLRTTWTGSLPPSKRASLQSPRSGRVNLSSCRRSSRFSPTSGCRTTSSGRATA